jgi:hypothetical protein
MEDKPFFDMHYAKYPQVHSDNTFTNMVCWDRYANYRYAHVNDSIIISSTIDGATRFRPPIGPRNKDLMTELIEFANNVGDEQPIVIIDRETAEWVRHDLEPVEMVFDRDQSEYVHLASDLADLPNGMYHSIRRQLNRFKKNYAYTVEPFSPELCEDARKFLDSWKQTNGDMVLKYEKEAFLFAIDHFTELGLSGLIIRVKGEVSAISIFERLNDNTAVIHFEKGLEDLDGIYRAINMETAAALTGKFEFINRESDMGIPGLREAKMRYHPHHMVDVYSMKGKGSGMHKCTCNYLSGSDEATDKVCL